MANPLTSEPVHAIAAGPFCSWLSQVRESLRGNGGMEVACGDCVGCCTSSYSVQLRPEDQRALARIPVELLFSPPGFPRGHMTMTPLPNGACPMLDAGKCSIYDVRPQTCLDYDCRIFAAAGLEAGAGKTVINRRVREWRFAYPTDDDRRAHAAVRSAAAFIRQRADSFPGRVPTAPMGIAVLAIKAYQVFLDPSLAAKSDQEIAHAVVDAHRAFDLG
jgi:Fe-S-cluster containining protein